MLKLIVFDCDGVMFDSKEANKRYYNDILDAFGRRPMDDNDLEYAHSHSVSDSITHIFRHYPDQDLEAVDRHRLAASYLPYLSLMRIEPDLVEFLTAVRPRYRLAISTNRTTTMGPLLEAHGLSGYFDLVVTARDVANPKPAPDALHKILSHCGCGSEEAIFIGDSEVDRRHTEAAGVRLIAFRNPRLGADYHVDTFRQILDLPPLTQAPAQRPGRA